MSEKHIVTNVDSSGNFPGVWVFSSDVSVTSVGSIFKGVQSDDGRQDVPYTYLKTYIVTSRQV
jgi:hypothetical protein